MHRTARRPLNGARISPQGALVFATVLAVAAVGLLWLTTTPLATALTRAAIAVYVLGYTLLLKRRTPSNIVWGGTAGCMPTLIGWAAVTGRLDVAPFVLFAVVFFWTPPHFWALAIRFREDYAAAGVPMLPVVAPAAHGRAPNGRLHLADRRRVARAVARGAHRMALPRRCCRAGGGLRA